MRRQLGCVAEAADVFVSNLNLVHRIRMQRESPRKFACTRQPVPRAKITAQNGQHHLRDNLPIDRNSAAMSKPESHVRPQPYCALSPTKRLPFFCAFPNRVCLIQCLPSPTSSEPSKFARPSRVPTPPSSSVLCSVANPP